jgi:hypothetical protein
VPRSDAFDTWAWAGVATATAMAAAALLHASAAASERARDRRATSFRISCENVTASSLFLPRHFPPSACSQPGLATGPRRIAGNFRRRFFDL